MQLEWMKQYRSLVEKFIRYANTYVLAHNRQESFGTSIKFSAIQIQTLEYIMENENMKMSDIARKLGVTRSAFSKNVKTLQEKGLLEKYRLEGNNKDIYVFATDFGVETYNLYVKYVYDIWFKDMFEMADSLPAESLAVFEDMIEGFANAFITSGHVQNKLIYRPLDKSASLRKSLEKPLGK